jgi:dihydrolipoamide dehydrogenase
MPDYDLVVLGAGPGGYVAAIRAAQLGLKTAVVERDKPGGVCGNWGCIPSKAILTDAALFAEVRDQKRGILADNLRVDYGRVIERSREVADRQAKGVEFLFKKNQIAYHQGTGRLTRGGVEVTADGSRGERLAAPHVLVATGSRERVPSGLEVDGSVVLTSREALAARTLPKSVVIIGGGAVGVEFAYIYNTFGAKVVVVEMAPALLPGLDVELGRELERAFKRQGMTVLCGHRFSRLERVEGGARVTVEGPEGPQSLAATQVLVAVGRAPLTEQLGLEQLGVRLEKGFVVTDAGMRTSAEGVYAIGDMVGPMLLAHTASEQGVVAVETVAGKRRQGDGLDPTRVPVCIYCLPEVASVGLSEEEARRRGHEVRVGKFPFRALGKAMASGHPDGFVKLVTGARHGEILGVHMIGAGVTDLIAEAGLARTLEATTDEVVATVHAHPTMAEALREAALVARGEGVNV